MDKKNEKCKECVLNDVFEYGRCFDCLVEFDEFYEYEPIPHWED